MRLRIEHYDLAIGQREVLYIQRHGYTVPLHRALTRRGGSWDALKPAGEAPASIRSGTSFGIGLIGPGP